MPINQWNLTFTPNGGFTSRGDCFGVPLFCYSAKGQFTTMLMQYRSYISSISINPY